MSDDVAPDQDEWGRAILLWGLPAMLLFGTLAIPHWVSSDGFAPADVAPTLGFGLILALLSAIDIRTLRLPDILTYPLGLAGLAQCWLMSPDDMTLRVLGAVAGFLMLALIAYLYRRARGIDGLGLGDAKLMGAGGAWIGLLGLPSALLAASGLALVLAVLAKAAGRDIGPETRLPFGPFIAIGLWIVWLYGPIV